MLEIQSLDASYGNVQVLKGLDLQVVAGEIVTLIGANGAGKSTTLKCVSGLLRARAGVIRYQGEEIQDLPTHEVIQRGLVTIMEGRRLFPDLDVLENLRLGAYHCRSAREVARRMDRVFTLFPDLKGREKQLAASFSGGQQQMIAIGRGLMAEPKLLMMDEPTLGLSPLMTQKVAAIIKAIQKDGITILLIEQNANMALRLANRGYVMETGKIVMEGPAMELLVNDTIRRAYLGI